MICCKREINALLYAHTRYKFHFIMAGDKIWTFWLRNKLADWLVIGCLMEMEMKDKNIDQAIKTSNIFLLSICRQTLVLGSAVYFTMCIAFLLERVFNIKIFEVRQLVFYCFGKHNETSKLTEQLDFWVVEQIKHPKKTKWRQKLQQKSLCKKQTIKKSKSPGNKTRIKT